MLLRSKEKRLGVMTFEVQDSWRDWIHVPGIKDPVGRVTTHGGVQIDMMLDGAWEAMESLLGRQVSLEGYGDEPRIILITDRRMKDVELLNGRPTTKSAWYGWEAVDWDDEGETPASPSG